MSTYRLKILTNRLFRRYETVTKGLIALGLLALIVLIIYSISPLNFPRGKIVRINKNMGVTAVANMLKDDGIIRSAFIYKAYVVLLHDGKGVQAGSYLFDQPQSALRVAYRTAYGISELQKIRVTIFEGLNSKEIGTTIKKNIPEFDVDDFISKARNYEGHLFPETYFFNPDVESDEVIAEMRGQFDREIVPYKDAVATSTKSLREIIIMASIIEKEANNTEDRRMVSGVLWNRIRINMPLQTDVPFYYIINRAANQLTVKDLATTSPYNTYLNKGLPPTPISNPGLDSIEAALYPTKSQYLFYLADGNGITHFAKTHDEHVANKFKYLQ
ncbi:MAG: endolytic transglycosylase MltG [Patescibacteria group bacterium]